MNRKMIAAGVLVAALAACGHANPGSDLGNQTKHPTFSCQEDELFVWVDHPTKARCVNVEEYAHAVHAVAGHVPMTDEDRELARFVPGGAMAGMDHGHEQ